MLPRLISHVGAPSAVAVAAALLACGGDDGTPTAQDTTPTVSVTVRDFAFEPETLTVQTGSRVRWTNQGPSEHTVTSDSTGVFASGTLASPTPGPYGGSGGGGIYHYLTSTAGTFSYRCSIHPSLMQGVLIVTP